MRYLEYIVTEAEEQLRLELVLRRCLLLTKKQISQSKFLKDGLTVNGKQERSDYLVRTGDHVRVLLSDQNRRENNLLPLEKPLRILYEDGDVLVLDKRAGEVCHPAHGHYGDTIANQVSAYLTAKGEAALVRCIGRLDKDTSGVLLFAKHQLAAGRLTKQKEEGICTREYLALVNGHFPDGHTGGEITSPIGPMQGTLMKMQVTEEGKEAYTAYRVLCRDRQCTLVACLIRTGRTHQIRVHMASIGHPLVGDPLYGKDTCVTSVRTALHAWKLCFRQPITGETVCVTSFGKDMFS